MFLVSVFDESVSFKFSKRLESVETVLAFWCVKGLPILDVQLT